MALDITPEERATGQANFDRVATGLAQKDPREPDGTTRRGFMKSLMLTSGVVLPVSAGAYFAYKSEALDGKPVKAALIGGGDEGGVLAGEHNPKYLEFVAVCDIRPTNKERIFRGELDKNKASPRKGLNFHYGRDADKKIKVYEDYKQMLDERRDIEAVVIALPLHVHAAAAIDCMRAGRHVLCEKLMAWNITQCKEMIAEAEKNDVVLSIGHQRHYSLLYAHAQEVLASGVLGDVRHIRALWHRNNAMPKLDDKGQELQDIKDSWKPDISAADRKALEKSIRQWGYKSLEELVRWRLFKRTGGGLMAELGSHQLDACSIFLGKVKPLAVTGVGGKYFYKDDREIEDHVFCTYEFPGPDYWEKGEDKKPIEFGKVNDPNSRVIVTYSSINTNDFENYGECVMGSRGSLVVEKEQNIQLYAKSRSTAVSVTSGTGGPALAASGSTSDAVKVVSGAASGGAGPVSKGYREEMEHFAYCIRMWKQGASKSDRPLPRCHGTVAMADAIIALTSNLAMKHQKRIEFKKEWFDARALEVPDSENKTEVVST